jgi:hypothetical protein
MPVRPTRRSRRKRGRTWSALPIPILPAREAELSAIFKEATRLEIEFWEMAWHTGQRGE